MRLEELVDWERGRISPEIFCNEELYRQELEQVFGRTWLFIAHESQIPKPGDYFRSKMGTDSVVVVRQRDGSVGAFLNACRHRGMKVCRADAGNTKAFMCPYHGWTYGLDGSLVNVPNLDDGYSGNIDMAEWGLVPVAQVESYKGFVFGNFDATAPSLTEYLGDFAWYLDILINRHPEGTEFIGGVQKSVARGNWKLAAEQFAGDSYHANISHASGQLAMMTKMEDLVTADGRQVSSPDGHGMQFTFDMTRWVVEHFYESTELLDYYDEVMPTIQSHLGPERARALFGTLTVFPSFSVSAGGWIVRTWHPLGPSEFEVWSWIFVDKTAPARIKDLHRVRSLAQQSISGVIDMDDTENWASIGDNLDEGVQVRKFPLHYGMGLGEERTDDPDYPGLVGPRFMGEGPLRGFYRRWLQFMTSQEWPHVVAAVEASRTS